VLTQAGNLTIAGTLDPGIEPHDQGGAQARRFARRVYGECSTSLLRAGTNKADRGYDNAGPMSEDFFAAFQVGNDDKGISVTDSAGVALAAIPGPSSRAGRSGRGDCHAQGSDRGAGGSLEQLQDHALKRGNLRVPSGQLEMKPGLRPARRRRCPSPRCPCRRSPPGRPQRSPPTSDRRVVPRVGLVVPARNREVEHSP